MFLVNSCLKPYKMKYKIFLWLTILSCCQLDSYAQSFVDPQNEWYVADVSSLGERYVYAYRFSETDTLIGAYSYKHLITDHPIPSLIDAKYYREEAGRVYIKDQAHSPEKLIYDFNLEEGDEVTVGGLNGQYPFWTFYAVSVEEVLLQNGETRKRIELAESLDTMDAGFRVVWIEGIGSNLAPMNTMAMNTADLWQELHCFKSNDLLVYQEKECVLGNLGVSVTKETAQTELELYPNPVKDRVILNAKGHALISEVHVFDVNGYLCKSQKGYDIQTLDVSGLKAALYLLQIKTDDGFVRLSRFIKQ